MLSVSPLYWDPDGDPANNVLETGAGLGGSGNWNNGSPLWYDPLSGSHVAWDNGAHNRAVFSGSSGNVSVAAGISADSLAFTSNGYALAGGSLQLSGASSGASSIDVAASLTSTITTQLVGTVDLTKTGAGTLTLAGANTYTGGTTIKAGTLRLTHTSGAGSGAVQIGDATLSLFRGGSTTTYPNAITSLAGTAGTLLVDGSGSNAGTGTNSTYATGPITVDGSLTVSRPSGGNRSCFRERRGSRRAGASTIPRAPRDATFRRGGHHAIAHAVGVGAERADVSFLPARGIGAYGDCGENGRICTAAASTASTDRRARGSHHED